MYFDTSYIAKFYLNEPESPQIRDLVRNADVIYSSLWAFAEFHAVLHRHLREQAATRASMRQISARFSEHIRDGLWTLIPVTESLLKRTSALILSAAPGLFLRTADAIHLLTAREAGESDFWTNDRHMLAAASHFGLTGRSV